MPSALDGTLIHGRIGRLAAFKSTISSLSPRHRLALAIALAVDFLQIVAFPLFAPGLASPLDDVLDLAAGGSLIALLGWHWTFLPAFAVELIPGLDLVPSWTAAVLLAVRRPLAESVKSSQSFDAMDTEQDALLSQAELEAEHAKLMHKPSP